MRELLSIQVETLFLLDGDHRLRATNDIGLPPAPRFFLGRTPNGNLWRARYDQPRALVAALARLAEAEPPGAGAEEPPASLARIRALLDARAPVTRVERGPAFVFEQPPTMPAEVVEITPADTSALRETLADWAGEVARRRPCMVALVDGMAVSICASARRGTHAAEAGVETLPAFRGRGLATRVTAAWASAVAAEGLIPLYSTAWENLASRVVARKLGLRQYGEDLHLT